jgi:hypothetical protein
MQPFAATGFPLAAPVSLALCFDVSRRPLRGGEFGFGNFDAKFLPLPKLIGNVLRGFRLLDRLATGRLHFSLENEKPPSGV